MISFDSADLTEVEYHLATVDRVKAMSPKDFPQQNISMYVQQVKPILELLEVAHKWDADNNFHLCRTLATCGGDNNQEYSSRLYAMLNDIEEECLMIAHLSAKEKSAHMSRKKLGWRDILKLAESKYKAQMIESFVRWPPACNAPDSEAAPPSFGSAHLPQLEHHQAPQGGRRNRGSGSKNRNKTTGRGRPQGNRPGSSSGGRPKPKNPKKLPPDPKAQPTCHVNGEPVFEKRINGRKFEWCAKCKRYSTTHNTGTHTGNPSGASDGRRPNDFQIDDFQTQIDASLRIGLLPDPSIWYTCIPIPDEDSLSMGAPFDRALSPNLRDLSLVF